MCVRTWVQSPGLPKTKGKRKNLNGVQYIFTLGVNNDSMQSKEIHALFWLKELL
jgi:hypothetical protein